MELRKINQEELNEILELHKLWLDSDEKAGKRANLSYADLSDIDLNNTDLSYADLSYADLSNANLNCANLSYAILTYVNLSDTDLTNANLSYADLSNADLSFADLNFADLSDANLSYANLRHAILTYADLSNVDLSFTDLYKTILFYAKIDNMVSIGNVGMYHRTVYYFYKVDRIICGCFDATLEKFKEAVQNKYGEDYGSYKKCIKLFEMYKEEN